MPVTQPGKRSELRPHYSIMLLRLPSVTHSGNSRSNNSTMTSRIVTPRWAQLLFTRRCRLSGPSNVMRWCCSSAVRLSTHCSASGARSGPTWRAATARDFLRAHLSSPPRARRSSATLGIFVTCPRESRAHPAARVLGPLPPGALRWRKAAPPGGRLVGGTHFFSVLPGRAPRAWRLELVSNPAFEPNSVQHSRSGDKSL